MTVPDAARRTPRRDLHAAARRAVPRAAGASHPGRIRDRNEDRFHVDPERGIFVVVDGMGGEAAGETAAETALGLVRTRLERRTGTVEERIREAITVANNEVLRLANAHREWSGMGCVLTVAVLEDGIVTVGHVGDSRLYRLEGGVLAKVTHDHSPVGEREDQGELSEREAMEHPRRNEVYRCVGVEERTPLDEDFIEIARFPFAPTDGLLLCSDGLTDLVPAADIERVVWRHAGSPEAMAGALVDAAVAAGGTDNVTVVVATGERFAASLAGTRATAAAPGRGTAPAVEPERMAARRARRGRGARPWPWIAVGVVLAVAAAWFVLRPGGQGARLTPFGGTTVPATRVLRVGAGEPHATIGEAMGLARAGDTVLVAPGIYREQVRLENGVTLLATEPQRAVVTPAPAGATPAAAVAQLGPTVAILAQDLGAGRIVGLACRDAEGAPLDVGIVLRNATVTVEDVEVSGARDAGIVVEGGAVATVRTSRIQRNGGAGIVVRAPAVPRIAHNMVIDNGAPRRGRDPRPGIDLEPGAGAELVGNVIARNGAEGVRGVPEAARAEVRARNAFVLEGRGNGGGAMRTAAEARP